MADIGRINTKLSNEVQQQHSGGIQVGEGGGQGRIWLGHTQLVRRLIEPFLVVVIRSCLEVVRIMHTWMDIIILHVTHASVR